MKKAKPIIFLVVTLIIGFALGFLTNSIIIHNKIKRFVHFGTAEGFAHRLEQRLQLTDQDTKAKAVIEKYAQQHHEIMKDAHTNLSSTMEQMEAELIPLLTAEQKDRLEKMKKSRHGFGGPPHGPPPAEHLAEDMTEHQIEALGLADSLRDQLMEINLNLHQAVREAREDRNHDAIEKAEANHRNAMKALLDSAQYQQFLELEVDRPKHHRPNHNRHPE